MSFPQTPQSFWSNILPEGRSEQIWLIESDRYRPKISYRDLQAKAHCVAAYLLQNGIERGQVVAIIPQTASFQIITELGLQMVGAVAVCLSNDQGPQQLFRTESQKLQEARYLFIESTDTVRNLDPSIIDREKLIGIVSSDASEEDLPLDKMVTFERVLTLGNNAWRELRGELEDRKKLPQPEDVCTCDIDANGNLSPVDYATWFRECESVVNQLKEDQISVAYSRGVQHTIDQRLHAFFAPLAHHIPAHFSFGEISLPFESEKGMDVAFVLDPETVNELYGLVSDDGKGNSNLDNKKFAQAYDLAQVIRECESNGKKVPAKHRIKSSMMQSTFYKSLRKKIGKNVTTIWYGPGDISDYVLYLIEDAGYKIHRIKDPRQAAVEATN